jgi:hypothetical protein
MPKRVKVLSKRAVSSKAGKPTQAKVQAKRLAAKKTPKREGSEVRELEKRLAEALKQRTEALERQTAASVPRMREGATIGAIALAIEPVCADVAEGWKGLRPRVRFRCSRPRSRNVCAAPSPRCAHSKRFRSDTDGVD